MSAVLEIKDLYKSFGNNIALDGFNITVQSGEIYGLLGPNGAGKTTFISAVAGLIRDFSGDILFFGKDIFTDRMLKKELGIVPQDMAFYEELGAIDNLLFWGGLYGVPGRELKNRAKDLLKVVGLEDRAKERVKNFSGGMKRRLNIAIGLIHKPKLLLLDEPTVGIDVQAKMKILDIIKQVGEEGTSVIFTTHQLSEVEEMCSRIGIMDHGKLVAEGTLDELKKIVGEKDIVELNGDFPVDKLTEMLKNKKDFELISVSESLVTMAFSDRKKLPSVLEIILKKGFSVSEIKIKSPNLESVFLKLTGRSLRD